MLDMTRINKSQRFHNQSRIINQNTLANTGFTVIGAGAIGSFFTLTLAKMGAEIIAVFDSDTIEDHNIANQMYPVKSVTLPKTTALSSLVHDFSGIRICDYRTIFSRGLGVGSVVVSCVDSMDTRKMIWESIKEDAGVSLFIDGRMGAQVMRVYAVNPKDPKQVEFYEKSLYSSAKAQQGRCAEKSIIYTVNLVTGLMLSLVKKHINGEKHPTEIVYDAVNYVQTVTYK